MKKLSIALIVLVLLIVVAVVVIASQAGSLIKNGVETYGPSCGRVRAHRARRRYASHVEEQAVD